jgi:hypothetical protein
VIARQADAVERAVAELFGELDYSTIRVTDRAGYAAGLAAADLADLAVGDRLRSAG